MRDHTGQTWLDEGIRQAEYCRKLDPDLAQRKTLFLLSDEKQDP